MKKHNVTQLAAVFGIALSMADAALIPVSYAADEAPAEATSANPATATKPCVDNDADDARESKANPNAAEDPCEDAEGDDADKSKSE